MPGSYNGSMSTTADNINWSELVRLFRPGAGDMPPKLAGREAALKSLNKLLLELTEHKQQPPREAVLYGPRGNGKTVLLDAFEKQCAGADVISLTPGEINTEADLAALLIYEDRGFRQRLEEFGPASGELDLKLFSVQWSRMNKADRDDHARRYLFSLLAARAGRKPLLVTLDEAHALKPEIGRMLLNASQRVRRQRAPFLLALAGTPNLRARLDSMNATFWDRAQIIGVGRLDAGATSEALEEPLQGFGIGFAAAALETVINESQRYPYFIQLWGEALCEALAARRTTRVDMAIVAAARAAFNRDKVFYYEKRYQELSDQGLLDAARIVAGTFRAADFMDEDRLTEQLAAVLPPQPRDARDMVRELSHLGFIWQPPASPLVEPGIPSLMDYVLTDRQRLAAARGR